MRKPSCLRQVFNAVLLLAGLALVTIAAAYAVAARQCLELKPTGDKLYDRFAAAVRARQGLRLYGGLGGGGALLPASAVLAWEKQYKDEPRYWQLRYWLGLAEYAQQKAAQSKSAPASPQVVQTPQPSAAPGTPAPPSSAQEPQERANVAGETAATAPPVVQHQPDEQPDVLPQALLEPLQQAVDGGVADESAYLLLYEAELAAMDPRATVEQRRPMLALLDRAVSFGSGLSWGYYLRALHRLDVLKGESVDWQAVRADLQQGNTAQRNARPLAFPQSYVEEQLADEGRIAGSRVLAGAVLEYGGQVQAQIPLSRTVAHATRVCLAHCVEANDRELAGEMLRCLCRMAAVDAALPQDKLDAASLMRVIAFYLGTRIDYPATSQQREDVFEASRWMDDASAMARVAQDEEEQTRLSRLAFYQWLSATVFKRAGNSGKTPPATPPFAPRYVLYQLAWELRVAERERIFERFNRLLADLGRFDFRTLSLPYDLSPVNRPKRLPPRIAPATAPADISQ